MMRKWQTLKVFISSTFRDMYAERDYLVKVVFPELRERLEKYKINLIDIDLRWGITKEQAENNLVLDLCLQQIDECRPFFISILGERYGWVPNNYPLDVLKKYGWIQYHTQKSITELEIVHGVLNNPEMSNRAFFYFRDPNSLNAIPDKLKEELFIESDDSIKFKLKQLKELIKRSTNHFHESYPAFWQNDAYDRATKTYGRLSGLQEFGKMVINDLWKAITTEYALLEGEQIFNEKENEDELEIERQEIFIRSRMNLYVERIEIQNKILDTIKNGQDYPILITGATGSGKSAILAWIYEYYKENDTNVIIIPHFVGTTVASVNLNKTLYKICSLIKSEFQIEIEILNDLQSLIACFKTLVYKISSDKKLFIIIDGINQFDRIELVEHLSWLPSELPQNVKIILSCLIESNLHKKILNRAISLNFNVINIIELSYLERYEILKKIPSLSARTLDEEQASLLLSNAATKNPLFLQVALEELKGFGSFEHLNDRIKEFPRPEEEEAIETNILQAIFNQVINRLESDFDAIQVKEILSYLACSRSGLNEKQLLKLINHLKDTNEIFSILRQVRPYLLTRGNLIDFSHHGFKEAIQFKYLKSWDYKKNKHLELAKIYMGLGDDLPWHLVQAKEWEALYNLLKTVPLLAAAWVTNQFELKSYWFQIEKYSEYKMTEAYHDIIHIDMQQAIKLVNLDNLYFFYFEILALLLADAGHTKEALKLQNLIEQFYERTHPDSYLVSLINKAKILQNNYQIDEALVIFDKAEETAQNQHNLKALSAILNGKAQINIDKKNITLAVTLLEKSKTIALKDDLKKELMEILNLQSRINVGLENLDEALELQKEYEEIARQLGEKSDLANCFFHQAEIYEKLNQLGIALKLFGDAENIWIDLDIKENIIKTLNKQAFLYLKQNKLNDAMAYFLDEERFCREIDDKNALQSCLGNQGLIFFERIEFLKALNLHKKEELICREINNKYGLQQSLGHQANAYHELGEYENAMRLNKEKERICRENNFIEGLQASLNGQANVLLKMNDFQGALKLYKEQESICLEYSILNGLTICYINQALALIRMNLKKEAFELAEKAKQIAEENNYFQDNDRIRSSIKFLFDNV